MRYLDSETLLEHLSDPQISVEADTLEGKIRERLNAVMPDEIGIVWRAIEDVTCKAINEALQTGLGATVETCMDGAIVAAMSDDPPSAAEILEPSDAGGQEVGEMISSLDAGSRHDFLRGMLDRLDKTALDDLAALVMSK